MIYHVPGSIAALLAITQIATAGDEAFVFSGVDARSVALSSNGRFLAVGGVKPPKSRSTEDLIAAVENGRDGILKVWDLRTKKELFHLTDREREVAHVAFSPKGHSLAVGYRVRLYPVTAPQPVIVWDVLANKKILTLTNPSSVAGLAYSADGSMVASAAYERRVGLVLFWDLKSQKLQRVIRQKERPFLTALTLAPGGDMLAFGSLSTKVSPKGTTEDDDSSVEVYSLSTGDIKKVFKVQKGRVRAISFSPNGRYLLYASLQDEHVHLLDMENRRPPASIRAHDIGVWSLSVSPDGKWLATGGAGGQRTTEGWIKLWRFSDLKLVGAVRGHAAPPSSLCFSQDGRYLASGALDGTAKVWEVGTLLRNELK